MKKLLLLFCVLASALAVSAQSLPLGTNYAVTVIECKTDFIAFADGVRFFDGLEIKQGRRAYYIDKPYNIKAVGQRLTFNDSDVAVDKVTVSLSQTQYGTFPSLLAAIEGCSNGLFLLDDVAINGNQKALMWTNLSDFAARAETDSTLARIWLGSDGAVTLFSEANSTAHSIGFSGEGGDLGLNVTIDGMQADSGQIMVADTNNVFQFVDFPFGMGAISANTDGSGDVTVTHGMGATPVAVAVTITGTTARIATVHTVGATTFKIRFFTDAGAAITSAAVTGTWLAKKT